MTDSSDRIMYAAKPTADSAIQRDAQKLQWAVRESVSSSPGAFLADIDDIDAKLASDWIDEIRLSTWAIVQRGDEILGIAAAKRPDRDKDKDVNQSTARFIESDWIAGAMRRRGIGRRLVEYLIDIEREKHHVQQFLLWVFDTNEPATDLYEDLGFKRTGEEKWLARANAKEIKYQLLLDSAVLTTAELRSRRSARENDWRMYSVRYRILGDQTVIGFNCSAARMRPLSDSSDQ